MLSDGRIRYSPPRDFAGVASFVYEVCGEPGPCGRTTVRVVVRPVNDEPVARDDVLSVAEDTPIRVAVLANDTDPDGDALNVTAVSNLSAGSATIEQNHVELELPDDVEREDRLRLRRDGRQRRAGHARGTVFVHARNDAPVAVDDSLRTPVGTPVRVLVLENDRDPDGDPVWVLRSSDPSTGATHNDGTAVTYTPEAGYRGLARFTYTIWDPGTPCRPGASR